MLKKFKNLNLDINKIEQGIRDFFKTITEENIQLEIENKKKFQKINVFIDENKKYSFDLYKTAKGCTLNFKCYKNSMETITNVLEPMGNWLVENISYGLVQKNFSLKIDFSTLEVFISCLKDNGMIITLNEIDNKKIYKISSGIDKVKTTLTYYSTNTLLIQGKPGYCYWSMFALLVKLELVDEIKEKDILMNAFNIETIPCYISKEERMFNLLEEDCKKMYESFLIIESNCQVLDLKEYSILCYYPLRISEAVLKNFIEKKLIPSNDYYLDDKKFKLISTNKDKNDINIFNSNQELNSILNVKADIKDAIEDLYSHFYINRHGLFHTEACGGSRCIENKEEAKEMNEKTFIYIENLLNYQ